MKHILCMGRTRSVPGPGRAKDMFHICMCISSFIIVDCLILSYIIPCFAWGVTPYFFLRGTPYFFLRGTFGGHPKQQIWGYPKKRIWGYPEEKVWGYPKL